MKKQSFKELFREYVKQLKKSGGFRDTFIDWEHGKAFDLLLKVWGDEYESMDKSNVTLAVSMMNLLAAVHVKKSIEELIKKIQEIEKFRR